MVVGVMSERDEYDDGGPPGFKDDEAAADGVAKNGVPMRQQKRRADGAAKSG